LRWLQRIGFGAEAAHALSAANAFCDRLVAHYNQGRPHASLGSCIPDIGGLKAFGFVMRSGY
jgi:hypothetical protein